VLSAAAVFVVVWPWIPVVTAVVAGATLGITAGFAWFTRANGPRIGRPSKQVMGVAVAGAVTLEIIVALAPRAPQPKLRTLRAVLRESGGRSLGDTFHWFAAYGLGSSASVAIQAIAIVLLLALQLGIRLLLTRTCLRQARYRSGAGASSQPGERPLVPGLLVWVVAVPLALGGGGGIVRTYQRWSGPVVPQTSPCSDPPSTTTPPRPPTTAS
jgi:hypothetical protein